MGGHEAKSYWEHVGLARLMAALLLPVVAWFLDLQFSYAFVKRACAEGTRTALLLAPLGSLALVGLSAWLAWSCWRQLRDRRDDGGTQEDRSYFLALAGLSLSAVFGLLIVASLAPRVLLDPCE
jgi:hypothetical protein